MLNTYFDKMLNMLNTYISEQKDGQCREAIPLILKIVVLQKYLIVDCRYHYIKVLVRLFLPKQQIACTYDEIEMLNTYYP